MTSSEIADKLDYAAGVYGDSGLSQAANTIRELEVKNKEWVQALLKASDDFVKSDDKLKIATEALEYSAALNCGYLTPVTEQENNLGLCVTELKRAATQALVRIKATNV